MMKTMKSTYYDINYIDLKQKTPNETATLFIDMPDTALLLPSHEEKARKAENYPTCRSVAK
jgi:hypothetical protein